METGAGLDGLNAHRGEAEGAKVMTHSAGRCEVQQVHVTKGRRKKDPRRRAELLTALPLDPRDPDIVRAKQLQQQGMRA